MGVTRDLQGNYIGITNSPMISGAAANLDRSEERRVGKECRL